MVHILKNLLKGISPPFPLLFWKQKACRVPFLPMVFRALWFMLFSCHQEDFNDKYFVLPVRKSSSISQNSLPLFLNLLLFSCFFSFIFHHLDFLFTASSEIFPFYLNIICLFALYISVVFILVSSFSSPECCLYFMNAVSSFTSLNILMMFSFLIFASSYIDCYLHIADFFLFGTSCLRLSSDI